MSRRGWMITALLIFVLLASPFAMVPFWIHTQFVNYRSNDQMTLASQTADITISPTACIALWVQHQTFNTEQPGAAVWEQARETWIKLPGDYLSFVDRAIYEDNSLSPLVFKSSVDYYPVDQVTRVNVTKQVAFYFPARLCQLVNS